MKFWIIICLFFLIKPRNWTTRATEMNGKVRGQIWTVVCTLRSVIEHRDVTEVKNDKAALFLQWSSVCAAHYIKKNATEKRGSQSLP